MPQGNLSPEAATSLQRTLTGMPVEREEDDPKDGYTNSHLAVQAFIEQIGMHVPVGDMIQAMGLSEESQVLEAYLAWSDPEVQEFLEAEFGENWQSTRFDDVFAALLEQRNTNALCSVYVINGKPYVSLEFHLGPVHEVAEVVINGQVVAVSMNEKALVELPISALDLGEVRVSAAGKEFTVPKENWNVDEGEDEEEGIKRVILQHENVYQLPS